MTDSILIIILAVFFFGMVVFTLAFSHWLRTYHQDKELRDR